jgi:hypothetical protein
MKFKVIEPKRKIQEDTKAEQIGKKTADVIQNLANIGRLFGVKTEFLTNMTNLVSSVISIFKHKKEYTDDEQKVIKGLISNSPQVNGIIQRSLGLSETSVSKPKRKRQQKQDRNKPWTDEEFAALLAQRNKQIAKAKKRK